MGRDDDAKIAANTSPPDTPEEWESIRSGVDKSHKAWVIIGPFYAVVINWKAIAIVVGIIVYINRPDIIAAIGVLAGGAP
jgi:hypothetical protein